MTTYILRLHTAFFDDQIWGLHSTDLTSYMNTKHLTKIYQTVKDVFTIFNLLNIIFK